MTDALRRRLGSSAILGRERYFPSYEARRYAPGCHRSHGDPNAPEFGHRRRMADYMPGVRWIQRNGIWWDTAALMGPIRMCENPRLMDCAPLFFRCR